MPCLTISWPSSRPSIKISLGKGYANQIVTIQSLSGGSATYVLVAQLKLNAKGMVSTARQVATGSTLRVLVAGKVIASMKVTGKG